MKKEYAVTSWAIEDVINAAADVGVHLTSEQAEKWWKKNEKKFIDRITEFGNELLVTYGFDNDNKNYIIEHYTIEFCPWCGYEAVIYSKGITACHFCGKPLAPCSVCETCDYATCPYGCTGGAEDEQKEITNPKISDLEIKFARKYL